MLSSPVLSISEESKIADISDVSLFSSGINEPLTTTSSISWPIIKGAISNKLIAALYFVLLNWSIVVLICFSNKNYLLSLLLLDVYSSRKCPVLIPSICSTLDSTNVISCIKETISIIFIRNCCHCSS